MPDDTTRSRVRHLGRPVERPQTMGTPIVALCGKQVRGWDLASERDDCTCPDCLAFLDRRDLAEVAKG